MATLTQRHPDNISGNFYVDTTCIDCDTCRWMAPHSFRDRGDQSIVYHQPTSPEEQTQALQALLSCPTASIGTTDKPTNIQAIQASFPLPLSPTIAHCGYHAESSFGAASYFIQRPDGNILVDSPRFAAPLVKRLEALGGIRYLYLTHRDDIADHAKFHDHFGCDRLLHIDDLGPSTQTIEQPLTGSDPIHLAPDLTILPVPGHTRGHTVLIYRESPDRLICFSGDNLAYSPDLQHLIAFRNACWYSWPEQIRSMERLAQYAFDWVLPGHGRRLLSDRAAVARQMQQCLAWMAG